MIRKWMTHVTEGEQPGVDGKTRHRLLVVGTAIALAAIALTPVVSLAHGGSAGNRAATEAVSVFASAPAPGHPFGIAVGDGRVYVSTSAGDFFADPANG